jgi:hypothetical protein
MDLIADADSLTRELEASLRVFDKWAAEQFDVIRAFSQEEQEHRTSFRAAMQAMAAEQKQIQQRTSQAKRDSQKLVQQGKMQADEQCRIQRELAVIPKEIQYLENLQYVLQVRRDRLAGSEQITDSQQDANARELRAFESIYGLSVSGDFNRITFNFKHPEAQIVLEEGENKNFRLINAPVSVGKIQATVIQELNAKRDLLRFLVSVRRCIVSQ